MKSSSIPHNESAGRGVTISDAAEAPHVGVPHALPGHGTHRKGWAEHPQTRDRPQGHFLVLLRYGSAVNIKKK
jgi:hypothetical protein